MDAGYWRGGCVILTGRLIEGHQMRQVIYHNPGITLILHQCQITPGPLYALTKARYIKIRRVRSIELMKRKRRPVSHRRRLVNERAIDVGKTEQECH